MIAGDEKGCLAKKKKSCLVVYQGEGGHRFGGWGQWNRKPRSMTTLIQNRADKRMEGEKFYGGGRWYSGDQESQNEIQLGWVGSKLSGWQV